MTRSYKIPAEFESLYKNAQEHVVKNFRERKVDPAKATIEIFGERYLLVRAATLSVDFFDTITSLYGEGFEAFASDTARSFIYELAYAMGSQDALGAMARMNTGDPKEASAIGPIMFSHSGWALLEGLSKTVAEDGSDFALIYNQLFSFEADAWIKAGKKSDSPVCVMNAGYAAGWTVATTGRAAVAAEILCQARGDESCRFILAQPDQIDKLIEDYKKKNPRLAPKIAPHRPLGGIFKRK